jgi:SOS-response transcriptional repressor LexA
MVYGLAGCSRPHKFAIFLWIFMSPKPKPQGPSRRERQLLVLIMQYQNNNSLFPLPEELMEEFGFNLKYILTLIGRLEKKRLAKRINGRVSATSNAQAYFQGSGKPLRANGVIPTPVRVKGTVRAGPTSFSDLDVSIGNDIESPIFIPNTQLERNTYALKVVGNSMEHENIFEGDYVIVEEFFEDREQPLLGEMIVAEYIPLDSDSDASRNDILDDEYMGLTLKVIKARENKSGENIYFLGWQKGNESNPRNIPVRKLRNVRRVIGVYRNLRKRK